MRYPWTRTILLAAVACLLLQACPARQRMLVNALPNLVCHKATSALVPPSMVPKDTAYTPGRAASARNYVCEAGR